MLDQLREVKGEPAALLLEPAGRNTAPAVTLAALQATVGGADPILVVTPADQTVVDAPAYTAALRIRKAEPALGDGPFAWIDAGTGTLAFRRGDDFVSVTSFDAPVPLPPHREVLLASSEVADGVLPANSTAWLRPQHEPGETHTTQR